MHFPLNHEGLAAARRRIAFEELLLYQVALSLLRSDARKGVKLTFADDELESFWKLLPFPPTNAQRRALSEMAHDLRLDAPMARLLQGDVGSGKTAVAFGAMYLAWKSGFQAALMAPTEVLAQQHYEDAQALFAPLGARVGLLTGSLTKKQHTQAHEALSSGEWDMVIGTHALITEGVAYQNLGLVITDEQHRFGVRQRTELSKKGESPNVLVMSATPIPRTLSLIVYGDLDLSILDELPPGRTPVKTRVVPEAKRAAMYGFVMEKVREGRQAYVICPLVDKSEAVEARDAQELYDELCKLLPEARVSLVHGRMKAAEKDARLEAFRAGERTYSSPPRWWKWASTCPTPASWSSKTPSASALPSCTSCAAAWGAKIRIVVFPRGRADRAFAPAHPDHGRLQDRRKGYGTARPGRDVWRAAERACSPPAFSCSRATRSF